MFFVKQKTAYELRISDWSSDGCSSDLPRLGIGAAQFADQVGEILVVDPADTLELRESTLGDEVEMRDHARHRGVVAVGLARLDRDALGKVARADTRRVETLDARQHEIGRAHV